MALRFISSLLLFLFFALSSKSQDSISVPRLVVSINIDQLRTDFMYEFARLYSDRGFKRLWSQGKVYPNGYYAFEQIDRASATATLMTGVDPYVHGIVGEQWLDRSTLRLVECTEDSKHQGLYTNDVVSPVRLKAISLPDEMKRATRGKAKVTAIAPYRDVAVMSGGHAADEVLWKNSDTGLWCSTSYYGAFPSWVVAKNKTLSDKKYEWVPTYPTEAYDNYGEKAPKAFKYNYTPSNIREYKNSACMNDEINQMGMSAIVNNAMGVDDIPDFLSLTYYAGNAGSSSIEDRPLEIQDIYVKLDANIADLLDELDKRFGLNNVLVTLSSTGYIEEGESNDSIYKLPSGKVHLDRVSALLNVYLGALFGKAKYVDGYYNSQFYLNRKILEQMQLDKLDVISRAVEFLLDVDGVEDVFTIYRLGGTLSPEMQYVKNGYNKSCSGDIWLRLMPGWYMAKDVASASNLIRRQSITFPMILFGAGVQPRVINNATKANIISPEVSKILRIRCPNDNSLRLLN